MQISFSGLLFYAVVLPRWRLVVSKIHGPVRRKLLLGCCQDSVLHVVQGQPGSLVCMQASTPFLMCLQGHHHGGNSGNTGLGQGTGSGYNQNTGNTGAGQGTGSGYNQNAGNTGYQQVSR